MKYFISFLIGFYFSLFLLSIPKFTWDFSADITDILSAFLTASVGFFIASVVHRNQGNQRYLKEYLCDQLKTVESKLVSLHDLLENANGRELKMDEKKCFMGIMREVRRIRYLLRKDLLESSIVNRSDPNLKSFVGVIDDYWKAVTSDGFPNTKIGRDIISTSSKRLLFSQEKIRRLIHYVNSK